MNYKSLAWPLFFIAPILSYSQNCLEEEELKVLDAKWEQALKDSDSVFLASVLAKEFIWIHNHGSMTDTKESLLKRATDPNGATGNPKSRTTKDIQVIIVDSTAIVNGITIVDRGSTPTTYQFMRTYIKSDGVCLLLANQTMAVPFED